MLHFQLDLDYVFYDCCPFARPLFVDKTCRILRFMFRLGQSVVEARRAPFARLYRRGGGHGPLLRR